MEVRAEGQRTTAGNQSKARSIHSKDLLSALWLLYFKTFITARIWRMREGNIFSLFTLGGGGFPISDLGRGVVVRLLPPASEGWGKVIFSVCSHLARGYPLSGLGGGGTPSQVWVGGYPISGLGVPHRRSGWWGVPGVPPGQVWMVGGRYPGYPPTWDGVPPDLR